MGCWNSCQEQMRVGLLFLFSPPLSRLSVFVFLRLKCGLAETLQVTPWFASLLLSNAWKTQREGGWVGKKEIEVRLEGGAEHKDATNCCMHKKIGSMSLNALHPQDPRRSRSFGGWEKDPELGDEYQTLSPLFPRQQWPAPADTTVLPYHCMKALPDPKKKKKKVEILN